MPKIEIDLVLFSALVAILGRLEEKLDDAEKIAYEAILNALKNVETTGKIKNDDFVQQLLAHEFFYEQLEKMVQQDKNRFR